MKVALDPKQAKDWFGAAPPDLSVIARSRAGSGRAAAPTTSTPTCAPSTATTPRPTGWNNLAFPNVGMPHVLWELQGQRARVFVDEKDPHDPAKTRARASTASSTITPGTLSAARVRRGGGRPGGLSCSGWASRRQGQRVRLGVCVLLFLAVFTVIAWRLNAAYWKDVK